jgi:hypothetical protein
MRRIYIAVAQMSLLLVANGWSKTGPKNEEGFLPSSRVAWYGPQVNTVSARSKSVLVGSSAQNEEAVRKTLADFVVIWNAHDMQSFQRSFGSLFTEDARLRCDRRVVPEGT